MKSGDRVKVLETGETGTIKAVFYHYAQSSTPAIALYVKLDSDPNECSRTQFSPSEIIEEWDWENWDFDSHPGDTCQDESSQPLT